MCVVQSDNLVQKQHCIQYKIQAGYIHEHYCPIHGSKIGINVPYSLSASSILEGTGRSSSTIGTSQRCSNSRQNSSKVVTNYHFGMEKLRWLVPQVLNAYILSYIFIEIL